MSKYVFVTGGVASGLGKGVTAASLGLLLKARGYSVDILKLDAYFNVDALYISPYQHGEVFVTDDGGDGDVVLGHYERFLNQNLNSNSEISSGRVYSDVISKERRGKYKGAIVQVVPHITDQIKEYINKLNRPETDIAIVEVGGVVGDIENHPYLEAVRQCRNEMGKGNSVCIHITLVPFIEKSGEQKTKPTQNSVKELQDIGIQPDIIVCRSDYPLGTSSKQKLSLFCNVDKNSIIESITTKYMYDVPVQLENEKVAETVLTKLKLENRTPELASWNELAAREREVADSQHETKIAVIGKYTEKTAAYQSLSQALFLAAVNTQTPIELTYIPSEKLSKGQVSLDGYDGIVVAPGFGERGFDGKVLAADYARKNNVACLMIGMGAQAAIVGFARDVCGLTDADSQEITPKTKNPVVYNANNPEHFKHGGYDTTFVEGSKLGEIYGTTTARERHRHKFEFNPEYAETYKSNGLNFTAFSEKSMPDAFEIPSHKFFIGVIYRPEFTSRPLSPHPLFNSFLRSAKNK